MSHSVSTTMTETLQTSESESCQVNCAANSDTPYIFLQQWVNEFAQLPNTYGDNMLTSTARSCNYLCIYSTTDALITPACPITCCGSDVTCQTCDPTCNITSMPTPSP